MPTQAILELLLQRPTGHWYGLEICKVTGLPSGTVYPVLSRLEQAGWIVSDWEPLSSYERAGRPARRYYEFSSDGAAKARAMLAAAYRIGRRSWQPGPTI